MKGFLFAGAGFLFLGLGAIGLLLPVWPTTPFVLLSAACFTGTPRLRARITAIPFFREYLDNYTSRCGLSVKTVTLSLGYLWGMLVLSMVLMGKLWLTLLLTAIGAAVTAHILWMARRRTSEVEP